MQEGDFLSYPAVAVPWREGGMSGGVIRTYRPIIRSNFSF